MRRGWLLAVLSAVMLAVVMAASPVVAATVPSQGRPAPSTGQAAAPAPPPPSLGPHGPALEGTWELVSMKLPDGTVLKPPVARGVILIEKGVYLAASYLQPTSARTVGSVWEGQLVIEGDTFTLTPKTGQSYDSMAQPRSHAQVPPVTSGTVARTDKGLVFTKGAGGTVTFVAGESRRIQEDPDGLVMEHVRTSLTPRMPDDLPGRETPKR